MFNTLVEILAVMESGDRTSAFESESILARRPSTRDTLSTLAGRRVLVVDDNVLNREVACDFLEAVGVEVDTAVNGIDALRQLEHQAYDAVLMDLHMPEMDGLAATRVIRRQTRWSSLPIIALTAQARVEDHHASLDAGMTAYLTKPIDEMALYKTISRVLTGAPASKTAARPAMVDAASGDVDVDVDVDVGRGGELEMSAALKRLGNDPARLERLLRGFLRDYGDAPARLENYLRAEDLTGIASLVHSVKGSASYFNAHTLCATAAEIEQAARRGDAIATVEHVPAFRDGLHRLLEQVTECLENSERSAVLRAGTARRRQSSCPHRQNRAAGRTRRLCSLRLACRTCRHSWPGMRTRNSSKPSATITRNWSWRPPTAALLRLKDNVRAAPGAAPPS